MQTKPIVLFFSAVLLVETQAIPRMRRKATEDVAVQRKQINAIADSSEESGEIERQQQELMTIIRIDFFGFVKNVTAKYKPLLKKTIEQLEALPKKSSALQANITHIGHILENNPNEINPTEDTLGVILQIINFMDFFSVLTDVRDMPAELEQTQALQKAFADNFNEKFREDFKSELKVLTDKFEKAIERYLSSLNEKQKASQTRLADWYTKLRNEKDEEKKLDLYALLFDEDE
ncbi:uncharacterized protein [Eurosta solidaginis]|uniref:uncharacterized protein n=1 Tax=Eurosta solidaginis TaxID=178769 RepID=UPI003530574A